MPNFYEFFAGGGMARAGLGDAWTCLFANDFDPKKANSYAINWGAEHFHFGDIAKVTTNQLVGASDLAWASFPCQDLSLAGNGAGLNGERSGTFWAFWGLVKKLAKDGRAPRLIALENVCGALTSHEGQDFASIGDALAKAGYRFGAVVINAVHFVPQSRPRLFIVGVHKNINVPEHLMSDGPSHKEWHTSTLITAFDKLSKATKKSWIWWSLPSAPQRDSSFSDLIEAQPQGVKWHTPAETQKLISLMNETNLAKLREAQKTKTRVIGTIYKRTRPDGPNGERTQRAELRIDEVAGCLRTPAGGSSRQTIMVIDGAKVRSRLLSPREAARLMGLPDSYVLPERYNDAYHLAGDGVAVPAVRFLAHNIIEPILNFHSQ